MKLKTIYKGMVALMAVLLVSCTVSYKFNGASINYDICRTCQNGACPNRFAAYARPDRIAALCNRTCLSHLEERDTLDNKFEMPFRQRDAWAIGGNSGVGRDTEKMNVLGGVFSKDGNRGNRK